ncbi:hypothetical protein THAOC_22611, partial [Thalassiosira oceanica]
MNELQKDAARKAVELYTEAAELGSIQALFSLGNAYHKGEGVQQDNATAVEFFTKAAMREHDGSSYNLGWLEGKKGNHDRAVRHFLISTKMGVVDSVESMKRAFMEGIATKEQYAEALKGYQDAVEEMKSHDRDEAKEYLDSRSKDAGETSEEAGGLNSLGAAWGPRRNERNGQKDNPSSGQHVILLVKRVILSHNYVLAQGAIPLPLALRYHPDKNDPEITGMNRDQATAHFQLLNTANSYLRS